VSSNIGQNYPYTSESERQRAAAVDKAIGQFEGLADKVATESTPLDGTPADNAGDMRWWVWVCPEHEYTGRLHVAGYAREKHALYTVCDTCGKTFLR
jgi:phage terminase large subunit GpA-like protein